MEINKNTISWSKIKLITYVTYIYSSKTFDRNEIDLILSC